MRTLFLITLLFIIQSSAKTIQIPISKNLVVVKQSGCEHEDSDPSCSCPDGEILVDRKCVPAGDNSGVGVIVIPGLTFSVTGTGEMPTDNSTGHPKDPQRDQPSTIFVFVEVSTPIGPNGEPSDSGDTQIEPPGNRQKVCGEAVPPISMNTINNINNDFYNSPQLDKETLQQVNASLGDITSPLQPSATLTISENLQMQMDCYGELFKGVWSSTGGLVVDGCRYAREIVDNPHKAWIDAHRIAGGFYDLVRAGFEELGTILDHPVYVPLHIAQCFHNTKESVKNFPYDDKEVLKQMASDFCGAVGSMGGDIVTGLASGGFSGALLNKFKSKMAQAAVERASKGVSKPGLTTLFNKGGFVPESEVPYHVPMAGDLDPITGAFKRELKVPLLLVDPHTPKMRQLVDEATLYVQQTTGIAPNSIASLDIESQNKVIRAYADWTHYYAGDVHVEEYGVALHNIAEHYKDLNLNVPLEEVIESAAATCTTGSAFIKEALKQKWDINSALIGFQGGVGSAGHCVLGITDDLKGGVGPLPNFLTRMRMIDWNNALFTSGGVQSYLNMPKVCNQGFKSVGVVQSPSKTLDEMFKELNGQ